MRKKQILIVILCIITVVSIGVSIWALFFRKVKQEVKPDYAPQQVEQNAEPINREQSTDKMEQQEGGGAVSLTYQNFVAINLSSKEADLMFGNPSKSNQNMKLEIVIDGKTIAKSGKLEPEFKIKNNSSKAVNALLNFTADSSFSSMTGEFKNGGTALTAPLILEMPKEDTAEKEYVVSFMPTAKLSSTATDATIGSITVTIA